MSAGQGRSEAEGGCSLTLLEQEGEGSRRERRAGVAVNNFIQKTYAILQEKRYESIVSWAEVGVGGVGAGVGVGVGGEEGRGGCSFRIHNVKAFEQIVLPMYFKHSNMSSFVRQLNMYNFHKVRGDKNEYEFEHEKFLRNRSDLLPDIKRKQVDSASCIPSIALIPPQEPLENLRDLPSAGEVRARVSQGQGEYESPDKRESSLAKVSSNDPEQQGAKLQELQEVSRSLKKTKQAKMAVLKQLTSTNRSLLAHKFNKAVMSALSSKLQRESGVGDEVTQGGDEGSDLAGMHALIEHIMDQSSPKTYEEYLAETDRLLHLRRPVRSFPCGEW